MYNLDKTIFEMTKDIQDKTTEWVFDAIDKTNELNITLYRRAEELANIRYPNDRRERIYAFPSCKLELIEKEIGTNTYNTGMYFIQRGASRTLRTDIILNNIEKDYSKKRTSLKNKILKQIEKSGSNIKEILNIKLEDNGTLGTKIILENNDKIIIEVITAGGYNIQCYHFRGLVKLIKNKGK